MGEIIDLGAGGGVLDDVIVETLCLLLSTGEIARPFVSDGLVAGGCTGIGGVGIDGISARSPSLASLAHADAKIF